MYKDYIFIVSIRATKLANARTITCKVRARTQREAESRLRAIPENTAFTFLRMEPVTSFQLDAQNPGPIPDVYRPNNCGVDQYKIHKNN